MFSCRWLSCLKTEWVQQRYVLAVMGLLGLVNCFTMRICLSVAIARMTAPPSNDNAGLMDETCSVSDVGGGNSTQTPLEYEFSWSEEMQGFILSSFYIGYILTHVPGGVLADRVGGKHTLGVGILGTALCTLVTPVAARKGDAWAVIVVRIIMGLGEGVTFPALNVMLAHWVPPQERSRLGAFVFAGTQVGTLVGNAISGFLLEAYVWDVTFYVFGILGVLWYVFWCILCYSEPSSHPFISDKEAAFLRESVSGAKTIETEDVRTPWVAILTSVPVWGLVISEVGHDWGFYTMVSDLPKYMANVLHYNISSSGWLSALPFLVMWICSMVTGLIADMLLLRGWATTTTVRKSFTTVASVGPGVFLLAASYAGCDGTNVVVLFCIGMGCMGAFYPGMRVNALDLSPRHAGTISAIANGTGSLAGIIAPYIIGVIAKNGFLSEWRKVFWITMVMLVGTNVAFLFMGSGDEQWWDDPDATGPNKSSNNNNNSSSRNDKDCEKSVPEISTSL